MAKRTVATCRHCLGRIVLVNFSLGEQWRHQPAGASGQDSMRRYCQVTVAEPDPDPASLLNRIGAREPQAVETDG